jgi:hypothetical protein
VKIVDLSDPKVGAYQQLVEQRARIKHLEIDVKGLWSMVGLSQSVDSSSLAQRAQGESIPLRELRYSGILDSHRDSSYFLAGGGTLAAKISLKGKNINEDESKDLPSVIPVQVPFTQFVRIHSIMTQ